MSESTLTHRMAVKGILCVIVALREIGRFVVLRVIKGIGVYP